jgi:hypothetical protein
VASRGVVFRRKNVIVLSFSKCRIVSRTHHRLGDLDTEVAQRAESADRQDLTITSAPR